MNFTTFVYFKKTLCHFETVSAYDAIVTLLSLINDYCPSKQKSRQLNQSEAALNGVKKVSGKLECCLKVAVIIRLIIIE